MNTPDISFVEVGPNPDHHHFQGFARVYQEAFALPPYEETYTDEDILNDVWRPHLEHGCVVIALDDNQIVGLGCAMSMDKWGHDPEFQAFIKANLHQLPDDPTRICFMTEVAVLPTHWRRGIGTQLAKNRLAWAKRVGMHHFMMRTAKTGSNSIRMYQRLGGEVMEGLIQDVSTHATEVKSQSTERVYIRGIVK